MSRERVGSDYRGGNHKETDRTDRQTLDAYFTVEAAVIVPVVFCLIIMLLYLMFFMYDRCIMTQDLYTAAYRQSIVRERGRRESKIDESRFLMLSECSCGVSDGKNVVASGSGAMSIPFSSPFPGVRGKWQIRISMKARKTDPPKAFRMFRRIRAIAARVSAGGS